MTRAPGSFLTERLDELLAVDAELMTGGSTDPADGHHAVSRVTLRLLLMAGLEDVLHFGKEFERYQRTADGRVTAHIADGTSAARQGGTPIVDGTVYASVPDGSGGYFDRPLWRAGSRFPFWISTCRSSR